MRMISKTIVMSACVGLSLLVTPKPAPAADAPAPYYVVAVGGTEFLRVRTTSGGLDASKRAEKVQERVNQALSMGPIHPADIAVGQLAGDWVVLLKGHRLFTADADTAKMDQTTPKQLAHQWAMRLKRILPELTKPTSGK